MGEFIIEAEVGEQKVSPWPQHTVDFNQEAVEIPVAERCLYVDGDITTLIKQRKALGVTLQEAKVFQAVNPSAKLYGRGRDVDPRQGARVLVPGDKGGAAAAPATDLDHILIGDDDGAGNLVIELAADPLSLFRRRKIDIPVRFSRIGEAVIHECPMFLVATQTRDYFE